jgi:hypothetical protein
LHERIAFDGAARARVSQETLAVARAERFALRARVVSEPRSMRVGHDVPHVLEAPWVDDLVTEWAR